ncbi:Isochorismatase-like protein [Coniella lustricola]|uniref:Isochorismatase-like protein n=1 Tax=Coniella lustricola TaxID=2025994 RepID=A0A2T2ZTZ5_9PEZI|nr:Isochorismatase-like protein [Coniella lustricola]
MPRSALFVVDIQHELAESPATRIPHHARITRASTQILAAARRILDAYRAPSSSSPQTTTQTQIQQSPSIIVFVQHEEQVPEGSSSSSFSEQATLIRGSAAWQLTFPPREGVREELLVAKTTRNTFESNPNLAAQLKSQDITELTIFGLQSDLCVRSTSLGALEHGFKVTLLQGAHSTYDAATTDGSKEALPGKTAVQIEQEVEDELRRAGAEIVPWENALALWEQRRMISTYSVFSELV